MAKRLAMILYLSDDADIQEWCNAIGDAVDQHCDGNHTEEDCPIIDVKFYDYSSSEVNREQGYL